MDNIKTIEWQETHARLIDQTKLPHELIFVDCYKWQDIYNAIKTMQIRGAPAIGIAGAYGVVIEALNLKHLNDRDEFFRQLLKTCEELKNCRPTAVNLKWAIDRMIDTVITKLQNSPADCHKTIEETISLLKQTALNIHQEDKIMCKKIGDYGAEIVPFSANILTHCNAGGLATSGYGTAVGVIKSAFLKDQNIHVWVDETRPLLQGARLTSWELMQLKIPCTLITDNMAGYFMSKGKVDIIVVGADRIAANGDTANKIGTYSLSVLAKENSIPFYVAAPFSTIDSNTRTGEEIIVENRDTKEVTHINEKIITALDMKAANPAFDITPNKYITGIITDKGIIYPPYDLISNAWFSFTNINVIIAKIVNPIEK